MISLGTVAGSFAYILALIFRIKTYIYQYERHSEFLKDFGIWSASSVSFKFLNYFERLSGRKANILATGTNHMINRLAKEGNKSSIYLLPSCVNEEIFKFNPMDRNEIRERLGIQEKKVVIYLGKFGGIYFELEAIASFFAEWNKLDKQTYFLILTPYDHDEIRENLEEKGLNERNYFVSRVDHQEVPSYLSAADMGVVAVPTLPSQKFRSPIKVGEYLCCGLPYVVGKGISEDDIVADKHRAGVVLNSYDREGLRSALPEIRKLFDEDSDNLRSRCRAAGVAYRGFHRLKGTNKEIFDQISTW